MSTPRETHGFQAEVRQLMQLMIHSLYSHREIFLRELISNASDANDKLRFLALSDPALLAGETELAIWIDVDATAGTLTIRDNGVGLKPRRGDRAPGHDRQVGHRRVLRAAQPATQQRDAQLIGQFGVGFYSAFIVADRVEVESRRADAPACRGRALGIARRWRIHRRDDRARAARHQRHPAPEGGRARIRRRLAAALAGAALFRPHRLPGAHGERGRDARVRGRQPGAGAVGAAARPRSATRNTAISTGTSATTAPIRCRGRTTASRASASTPACCTCPRTRPSTCGSARRRAA